MQNQALDHLRTLSVLHFVYAGMTAIFATIPIVHVIVGAFFLFSPPPSAADGPPPELFGGIFLGVGLLVMGLGWTKAILMACAGLCLRRARRRTLCLVAAGVACMFMPLGSLLGAFTIMHLLKDPVRELFEEVARGQG